MTRKIILSTVLATLSTIGFSSVATATNWVNVVENNNGVVYKIDLDSRESHYSKTGWRHVYFAIANNADGQVHKAIASCNPYQVNSPDYGWEWLPDDNDGYGADTVGGQIARAACNW